MRTVLSLLYFLGTAAAIPTNARFLSALSQPTVGTLETHENTETPFLRTEDEENEKEMVEPIENQPNNKDEQSSMLQNHEQLAEQDKSYSEELGLKDQEESPSDSDVTSASTPTVGTLDSKEDMSEPQEQNFPENTDSPVSDVSSLENSNQEESIPKGEENQEQPISEAHHQLNRSSTHTPDLSDQGNQEDDPNIPNGEEEEKEPAKVSSPNDNQEKEGELSLEHSDSEQDEDDAQPDDIMEETSQPTQVSEMQKDESEQGNQEQEEVHSDAEMEEENASDNNKHVQDNEWQTQEGKTGLEAIRNQKGMGKMILSEASFLEPNDDANIVPRNHGAEGDGNSDGSKHGATDDYLIPSQAFVENERAQSNYHHPKNDEQRERALENESVDTSEPGDHHGAKKAESSSNEDEASSEGNVRVHSIDSCVNFQCKRGHVCKADLHGNPHCVCQDPMTCPPAKLLDQVCGTDNQTYTSSCHLFATKCKLEGTKKGHQLQLDYFGACKSIPACTDFEVTQFPLRMRDWLKNILMQLYEPNPEHPGYLNEKQRNKVKKIYLDEKRLLAGDHPIDLLLRDFKKNYHMYVYPVHWQFSELDQHPMDRVLTHSELAPLRASLVPMEHCITRFFEECDPNKDKHITLKEWGHCFGIKEEDIDENLLF
ncbi:SPARC-like protein 1 [Ochotona curzoniae]|uniref:SPARC-like protein 1 n=1 Tax=Ochotona curzoniae TaxID=130825 RepID=UPI001B35299D|nr:SPARC-like protein 1 [Ochotona curzoniae]